MTERMKNRLFLSLGLLATVMLAPACTPTKATRGIYLKPEQVKAVRVGDNKSAVLQKIGSPTTKSMFDDNKWYYVGQQTEKEAFFDPKVTSRHVYEVTFTPEGLVTTVYEVDSAGTDVPIVRRKTLTEGHDYTFAQQLLGNLGKFNKSASKKKIDDYN